MRVLRCFRIECAKARHKRRMGVVNKNNGQVRMHVTEVGHRHLVEADFNSSSLEVSDAKRSA